MNTCKRIKTQKYGQWNSCELLALMAPLSTVVYPVFLQGLHCLYTSSLPLDQPPRLPCFVALNVGECCSLAYAGEVPVEPVVV